MLHHYSQSGISVVGWAPTHSRTAHQRVKVVAERRLSRALQWWARAYPTMPTFIETTGKHHE
jgi:hypothetical protein